MRLYYVLLVLVPPMAWAVWQLVSPEPLILPVTAGILLLVLGGLAGLRIGTDSVGRFVKELIGLNKYLGEQNLDLVEMNLKLLGQLSRTQVETQDSAEREPVEPQDSSKREPVEERK